ncbi:hypothetical protein BM590_A0411 [Brucella melitensis M5-90]|nr:hypothetical protein BM590_A0411 [Brucella melitensis M5-90]
MDDCHLCLPAAGLFPDQLADESIPIAIVRTNQEQK